MINALRKEVDRRQIEFLKSGKRVPVQFSSRYYDFKRSKWVFGKATEENIALLVARKVYWQTKVAGGPVWIGDPTEALFLETSPGANARGGAETAGPGIDDPPGRMGFRQCVPDGAGGEI